MRDKSIARGIDNQKSHQRRILHQIFKEQQATSAQASEQQFSYRTEKRYLDAEDKSDDKDIYRHDDGLFLLHSQN